MKLFNITMGSLFVVFALLQYNDPDPYIWIPIYGVAALLSFMNAKGNFDKFSHWGVLTACLIYGVSLVIKENGVLSWMNEHNSESLVESMKATKPWIENAREFGGLLIICLTNVINLFGYKKAGA